MPAMAAAQANAREGKIFRDDPQRHPMFQI